MNELHLLPISTDEYILVDPSNFVGETKMRETSLLVVPTASIAAALYCASKGGHWSTCLGILVTPILVANAVWPISGGPRIPLRTSRIA